MIKLTRKDSEQCGFGRDRRCCSARRGIGSPRTWALVDIYAMGPTTRTRATTMEVYCERPSARNRTAGAQFEYVKIAGLPLGIFLYSARREARNEVKIRDSQRAGGLAGSARRITVDLRSVIVT